MTEFVPTDIVTDSVTAIGLCMDTMSGPEPVISIVISIGVILMMSGVYYIFKSFHRMMKGSSWGAEMTVGVASTAIGAALAYFLITGYLETQSVAETVFNTYMNDYTEYYRWDGACSEEYIRQLAEDLMR